MMHRMVVAAVVSCAATLVAQTTPPTGLRENTPRVHALVGARVIMGTGKIVENGTLVVRDGAIEAVGEGIHVPPDARVWDMKGATLYPGFIDLASGVGLATAQAEPDAPRGTPAPPAEPAKGTSHWNAFVRAHVDAAAELVVDPKGFEKLRSQGFTTVLAVPQKGIFRGSSAVVELGEGETGTLVLKGKVAQHIAFEHARGFAGGYPNSLLGTIALIRQTWYDADWYHRAQEAYARHPQGVEPPETDEDLAALDDAVHGRQPVVFEVGDDIGFLRAAKLAKEFDLMTWIRGSGQEYRRLAAIKATGFPVIVPLAFPDPPDVETPEEAMSVSLEDLRYWDTAPENPGRLEGAGVTIALTADGLKDPASFLAQLRTAVQRGLSKDAALAALTTTPARLLGLQKKLGTLEPGKVANIIVADTDLFDGKGKVLETWIEGTHYEVKPTPEVDVRGVWKVETLPQTLPSGAVLSLRGETWKPEGTVKIGGISTKLTSVAFTGQRIALTFSADSIQLSGVVRLSGTVAKTELAGVGQLPDGTSFSWKASRAQLHTPVPDTSGAKPSPMASFPDVFPPGAFGRPQQPDQPKVLMVKNATIWTEGPQGKIEHADLLMERGKIVRVGTNLTAPSDAVVIDASGKQVTPGIIDCHSHTSASSINETGQAITAEVRIEDVIDPDEIWIYRQLAGGTTIANVLHGSANPIGGQNAVVKWRWGSLPDEMLMNGAPPSIKFALGENVKQSNFMPGGRPSTRYPQTRMGVEQIIRDEFQAARDYEKTWNRWEAKKEGIPPRKDLELDAILEVLRGKRLVHAHSYRQDEILMLMRVAEQFGFRVATFQHVLEGYKVADAIAKHGAGASSFSDWWAYKIEAYDAIPGNGPIMHDQGVLVSYNSDDSQLATRLNWEAAKAIPFGFSEEEALKLVTINSAKQMRIDSRVGSLEPGKDADFVIWSGDPLSAYSICEQTWIDGRRYFDRTEDQHMREEVQRQRAVIIQKILAAKKAKPASSGAGPSRRVRPNEYRVQSCKEGFDHE